VRVPPIKCVDCATENSFTTNDATDRKGDCNCKNQQTFAILGALCG
jgi:hypothetical protein